MRHRSPSELYASFLELVHQHAREDRADVRRQLRAVLLWCFAAPLASSAALLLASRAGYGGATVRWAQDGVILLFPVGYAVYFLSKNILRTVPAALRRGGLAASLEEARRYQHWRAQVSEHLSRRLAPSASEARWLARNFALDLEQMRHRSRFLTALGGAVFFLILQGLDTSIESEMPLHQMDGRQVLAWIDHVSSQVTQLVGLGFFLVMLYLSDSEVIQSLERYLHCVRELGNEAPDP